MEINEKTIKSVPNAPGVILLRDTKNKRYLIIPSPKMRVEMRKLLRPDTQGYTKHITDIDLIEEYIRVYCDGSLEYMDMSVECTLTKSPACIKDKQYDELVDKLKEETTEVKRKLIEEVGVSEEDIYEYELCYVAEEKEYIKDTEGLNEYGDLLDGHPDVKYYVYDV